MKKRQEIEKMDRRKFIGGSDVAAILGVSPYQTAYDLWEKKTAPDGALDPESDAKEKIFARGKRFEPVILEMVQDELEIDIVGRQVRLVDQEHDFLSTEIDFVSREAEEYKNGEIKSVSAYASQDWGEEGTDEIPVWYTAQVMHGLAISHRRYCRVAALIGTDDLRHYVVERDEKLIVEIRRRTVEFWTNHVKAKVAPPIRDAGDARKIQRLYRGITLPANEELEAAAMRLLTLKAEIKEREKEVNANEEKIQMALAEAAKEMALPVSLVKDADNNAYLLDSRGNKIASWNVQNHSAVNQKMLREKFPNIFNYVYKTQKIRVMRTHKPKEEN